MARAHLSVVLDSHNAVLFVDTPRATKDWLRRNRTKLSRDVVVLAGKDCDLMNVTEYLRGDA